MRPDPVLCLTPSTELAAQVRRALAPLGCGLEIMPVIPGGNAANTMPAVPEQPWAVILLDPAALPAHWEDEISRAPDPGSQAHPEPLILSGWVQCWRQWLAQPSSPIPVWLGRERVPPQGIARLGIVDTVRTDTGLGQLAFVVRQQMAASHWRRLSRRRDLEIQPRLRHISLRHELYNPLASILGNAELALQTRGRMAPELRLRIERIASSAARMRDLLQSPQGAQPGPAL